MIPFVILHVIFCIGFVIIYCFGDVYVCAMQINGSLARKPNTRSLLNYSIFFHCFLFLSHVSTHILTQCLDDDLFPSIKIMRMNDLFIVVTNRNSDVVTIIKQEL